MVGSQRQLLMRGGGRDDRNTNQSDAVTTAAARVCLVPARADRAVLDGGWWPRSTDPVAELGWFASLDPALAVAVTERGDQLDLLVVPPHMGETAARSAMTRAADPTDTTRAPDILASVSAQPARSVVVDQDANAGSAWDNEGGSQVGYRPHWAVNRAPTSS
jgi:hypothetical protein